MPVKVAVKRPTVKIPVKHAVYDLSEPLCGYCTVIVMFRRGMNWIYAVEGIRVTKPLGNHPECDDPDETMRQLGYWVREK